MQKHQPKITKSSKLMTLFVLTFFALPSFAYDNYHLMNSIYWFTVITQDIGIAMGVGLFLAGLFKLKRYGEMRTFMSHQVTITRPLGMMFGGVALLCLPIFTKTLLLAFWGYSNPLSYPMLDTPEATELIKPIIALIRLVGLFGVMRGIILFSRAGGEQSQPGQVGKALLHILGGLLCLHILNTYSILRYIFEFDTY